MDPFASAQTLMSMSERTWARHANPLSVWTRFTILPLLALAIWSRVWIGWWALLPVALVAFWTWVNPRAFPPPADYGSWASRGTLGERLYLDRASREIPAHHRRAATTLTSISALGLPPFAWGLATLQLWPTLLGITLIAGAKAWFVDRMVWLHADLTGTTPGTPLPDPTLPQGPDR